MKLIKPSFEILEQGSGIDDIYRHIEVCGRTCYKSSDKITNDSSVPFVQKMIASKHFAMLEHGTIYLKYETKWTGDDFVKKYENNEYSRVTYKPIDSVKDGWSQAIFFITTNLRVLVENKWLDDLKYICKPEYEHIKRYTVKFVCNRQVSHEFVRHRVFSFAQESTRYCNYTKDRFGGELTFIEPCWGIEREDLNNWYDVPADFAQFYSYLIDVESMYNTLIASGWKPQQAATVLPNALKTELIMTGFADEDGWKHFFELRALGVTGAPHPQAKELAEPLMHEFINRGYIKMD